MFQQPIYNSSNTNNTHTHRHTHTNSLEGLHISLFPVSNYGLVPWLKKVRESIDTVHHLFLRHQNFSTDKQCSSEQYFSLHRSIAKTAFIHFVSLRRSFFFFLCMLT